MVVTPLLLLAACSDDPETPPAGTAPDGATSTKAQTLPAPANKDPVPLRLTPEGLLGFPTVASAAPPARAGTPSPSAAPAPSPAQQPAEDTVPSEMEVRALYEGIMYTYAFDACGLPLIGLRARQDIEQRIEVCPNPPLRKDAFRTVYHRAIEVAEQDPEKMRASASQACPDKREFLRRVMSHASELSFDDSQPQDCSLLSPSPPDAAPTASGAGALRAGKSP
jgi:DNA-binding transcriptional regulator/RsmH inhibitor MraZ